jgi:hypothetical protein
VKGISMAKAIAATGQDTVAPPNEGPVDMFFLVVPESTYKSFSDVAARRNMTVTQALAKALSHFISETLPVPPIDGPQLLVEENTK